ncbi:MAG: trifunctional serine/threonine-protein kinase/ATP-binding protein/sensor histidine kinase [Candidatus Anammoxibacter sp.]
MTLTLSDYKADELIYEGDRTLVYRGFKDSSHNPVIIKTLNGEYPTLHNLVRIRHEYDILKELQIDGIVKAHRLEKYRNNIALIMEDVGGMSLREVINTTEGIELNEFFDISIRIAAILGDIHKKNVIHKDINPRNIIITGENGCIKIIDFCMSSVLKREEQKVVNPESLEGSLPYISPEQTGRMNRGIDYRTDYYSLGVTLYELLTGTLPFKADYAIGWVHCHIAKEPQSIRALKPDVPEIVEKIIFKLMSKNAEDRYQGTAGLVYDLKECRKQWTEKREITGFVPGQQDISEIFQIPQKLYGREKETCLLEESFSRIIEGGSEMLLVAGYSGIGKSSLINEIHKPIVEKYGYFISGKFDQFQRYVPYSALTKAFQGLMSQLITGSAKQIERWKEELLNVLGPNGQVIIEVIPEVEWIIGSQPPIAQLEPEGTQNRFNTVFQNFLQVFAKKENPLVIFLDDLQWADSATLNLMRILMTNDDNHYFLLVGAYRDNEVDHTHPLAITLEDIRKAGSPVHQLTLKPLALDNLNQMISETVNVEIDQVIPLSHLVMEKTEGNPFFVIQFLETLYHEHLLSFDNRKQGWSWDIAQIKAQGITDNVVDLMVKRLKQLPESTQELIRLGACIGNTFNLKTLAIISEQSIFKVANELWPAVKERLILPQGEGHHLLKSMEDTTGKEDSKGKKPEIPEALDKFLHDRVQQAAYSLIEDDRKKNVHLNIGRLLLKETPEDELENYYFDIVEHFNKSISLIEDENEKIKLAELNMKVGQKAKESTAYGPALEYFTVSSELIPTELWKKNFHLTFEIHKGLVACQFLAGKHEQGIRSADELLKRCESREDQVEINNILILYYGGAGQMDKAINIALDSLRLYNIRIPRRPGMVRLLIELAATKLRQIGKSAGYLKKMPETKDEDVLRVFSLLRELVAPTYLQGLLLLPYIILRMFKLTLIHGNSSTSSFIYSAYGLLWSKLGVPAEAYKFGKLALEVNKHTVNPPMEARCIFNSIGFTLFWKQAIKDSKELRKQGLQKLVDTGESFWASYIYMFGFWQEVALSETIEDVVSLAEREIKYAHKVKQIEPFHIHTLHRNLFLNLMGRISDNDSLDLEEDDEKKALDFFGTNVTSTCGTFYHTTSRLVLYYYYEQYKKAAETATDPKVTSEVIADPTFNVTIYTFYTCLAILGAFAEFSVSEKKRYKKILSARKKKIKKWQRCGPANFTCMLALVEAEEARVQGQDSQAMDLYRRAIKDSEKMESFFFQSLANELFAKFWLSREELKIARVYMAEAYYLYITWGANAKAENLKEKYSHLITRKSGSDKSAGSTGSSSGSDRLDLTTIIKASQAISGEIVLEKLLEKLMKILIENAGAQKGLLIMEKEGQLSVEAEGDARKNEVRVLQGIPIENFHNLPLSVIKYTEKSQDTVVLSKASTDERFANDRYIKETQMNSLLCAPIINQGKLTCILYLENNLAEGVFTDERLELLKILSAQVAVSIENSIFYSTLENRVRERTEELKQRQGQLVESEKMAALGRLVAGVAHEINTPVGIGVTASSTLKTKTDQISKLYKGDELTSSDFEKFINNMAEGSNIILKNLKKASDLIGSFKQIAVDQSSETKRWFNLKEYIHEIFISLTPKLKNTKIKTEVECSDNISLNNYPGVFSQIITNFIMNSLQHGFDESDEGCINIKCRVEGHSLILCYSDNGKGMTKNVLNKIFDPFFTTNRQAGGSGLGMYIIYNLVTQKLNGKIKCDSEEGKGVLFEINIPAGGIDGLRLKS